MKTARKILQKHYDVDNSVDEYAIIQAMKEYAEQVAKQALINANNRVGAFPYYRNLVADKILNESNIPKL